MSSSSSESVSGCQRIMPERSAFSGLPCRRSVYKNKVTGQVARYCSYCISRVRFRMNACPQLLRWGITLEEATAGKLK